MASSSFSISQSSQHQAAVSSGDLSVLISPNTSQQQNTSQQNTITIHPTEDNLLSILHARFRNDLPYSRISPTHYLVVNPLKDLASANDASKKEYEERCYRDVSVSMMDGIGGGEKKEALQPHLYDMACRVYFSLRRRGTSQAVLFRGITSSGKTQSAYLMTTLLLQLSTHSKHEKKLSSQINCFNTLLTSFGNSKTLLSSNASRHSRYTELHFSQTGRIAGAKILAFGLDKSRLGRLTHEERTFHVFYQLLSGSTLEERDRLGLEDPSDYKLLSNSGCYRLPNNGPFSDDANAMKELRFAFKELGFKTKHVQSIFSILTSILLLSNIEFVAGVSKEDTAHISPSTIPVLERVATLLGVNTEELERCLTNKGTFVKREYFITFLDVNGAERQKERLMRDLYSLLFAFVVETANQHVAPPGVSASNAERGSMMTAEQMQGKESTSTNQIILLDLPGFQSCSPPNTNSISLPTSQQPLISAYGQNTFDEFMINFQDELLHSFVTRNIFEDDVGVNSELVRDGLGAEVLSSIRTMGNEGCVELLRGAGLPLSGNAEKLNRKPGGVLGVVNKSCSSYKSGKSGDRKDEEMLQDLQSKFNLHASFEASPSFSGYSDRTLFGINHYSGSVAYDVRDFIEKDADLLDSGFVGLMRRSSDSFVGKLWSGPCLSVEVHPQDREVVVMAQVSSRPLREPTPIGNSSANASGASRRDSAAINFSGMEDDNVHHHSMLDPGKIYPVTTQINYSLSEILSGIQKSRALLWTVTCLRPNDSLSPNSFDKRRIKQQLRSLLIPDMLVRVTGVPFTEYGVMDFCERFVPTMMGEVGLRIGQCARKNGWVEGKDYWLSQEIGAGRIWLNWDAWRGVEDGLREVERGDVGGGKRSWEEEDVSSNEDVGGNGRANVEGELGLGASGVYYNESKDNLLVGRMGANGSRYLDPNLGNANFSSTGGFGLDQTPAYVEAYGADDTRSGWGSEWDKKRSGDNNGLTEEDEKIADVADGGLIVNKAPNTNTVEEVATSRVRRWWLRVVRLMTWYIPDFLLRSIGRMKRPDVRLAWREKLTICMLIFLACGLVIFYIIVFGILLCPDLNKAWNIQEVNGHSTNSDFWVAIQGRVYDVTNFAQGQHSDMIGQPSNPQDILAELAGQDLTNYFVPPFTLSCAGLVSDPTLSLQYKNFTPVDQIAVHTSGPAQSAQNTKLDNIDWYPDTFVPKIDSFYKGPLVITPDDVQSQASDQNIQRQWAIYNGKIYDLTDYLNTMTLNEGGGSNMYQFLDTDITDVFQQQAGQDITNSLNAVLAKKDQATVESNMACLGNAFLVAETDFRKSARCQVQNYLLLAFSSIILATIASKFLAALQLSSKKTPEMLDKFVLCQVPCYTEGEDSLRRTINSLAALRYDDKRKLLFIICDGNIIGSGNDRPTPRIVLDILGVDSKLDPEPLLFKSVGEGSAQLNYGKVYSGLYEFEGHVVPYIVVVKVGKPSERSKPGNRGKRDSQILLMHYLNRVHFDAPMNPLELEIYHQMRNVIGIDPAFYEYIFTVDADTSVTPESLNRLVACAADDSSVIGVCGETKLDNEEGSWWTMIQVYEYYISHHLAKAFESLFGSVTCLPGCFSLYRIRTADKGRPIIISNRIIDEYSEGTVDTLHKKNLFSLGEDRFLTTLMMKHFPTFKCKFTPDAIARTIAPESWSVLLSQRRRWINSTVHNLCELVFLPEMCGFCFFSMRFIVFIDLMGTIILPATAVYLLYLIITVADHSAPIPIISLILIGAVYGLQAIIFILKREFMLVGWMVVYLLSYPVYSFFLPLYSFWYMDDFSWGNTRLVVGEGNTKKVVVAEDEKFDESMIPLKKFSEYEAEAWETGSHPSDDTRHTGYDSPQSKARSRSRQPSRPESPRSYHQSSHTGDYYRDTNLTYNASSNPNLRIPSQPSLQSLSQRGRDGAKPHYENQPISQYGGEAAPQLGALPFLPYSASIRGSDYGGPAAMMPQPFPQATSMYGMGMPLAPHNSMFGFGGGSGSQLGTPGGLGVQQRPMSTFSFATSVNPFAGPSMNPNPSDDELISALRAYLSTQDLMAVTKKTTREAIAARFPKADLISRKDFLNQSIDKILSEA